MHQLYWRVWWYIMIANHKHYLGHVCVRSVLTFKTRIFYIKYDIKFSWVDKCSLYEIISRHICYLTLSISYLCIIYLFSLYIIQTHMLPVPYLYLICAFYIYFICTLSVPLLSIQYVCVIFAIHPWLISTSSAIYLWNRTFTMCSCRHL